MQNIKISELKKHPRNEEFFDDMEGDKWTSFLESVERRGIVESIVVTQDLMIVSGHQRVRACEEMGLLEVPCRIVHYPDYDEKFNRTKEDMILEDLICTNIMQRGVGNVNPMKMARCIQELERIKGIRVGKPSNSEIISEYKTQKNLAEEIGLNERQLRNFKKLTNLIPELQQMVENGSMKATVGYKIWARMSQEEQEKFFEDIGREKIKKLSQKATQQYIDKIRNLEKELENEKNKKPIIKEVEKVVDNTDYSLEKKNEYLKKELKHKSTLYEISERQLDNLRDQLNRMESGTKKYNDLKKSIDNLTKEKDSISRQIASSTELSGMVHEIEHFLKNKLAPITYSRAILDCKDNPVVIKNINEIVQVVEKWCMEMRNQITGNKINIDELVNNVEFMEVIE